MANKTLHSNQIAFIDTTDDRRLNVHITSNLPTSQIYDTNTSVYTPDWSSTNLQLDVDAYLDSKDVTTNSQTSIKWYKKVGAGAETQISTNSTLIISINEMSGNVGIITYICKAEYQGIEAQSQITFTKVNTGLNGSNGEDGTSVTIDGTAYYNGILTQASVGSIVVLYSDAEFTTPLLDTKQMETGDSYIVQGYLCVYSPTDDAFICTGTIQGPKGDPGQDAKSIILNGDSQVFKISKTNIISPTTITVTAQTFNTSITNWTYSTNGGQTFLSTVPTGVSRNGNIVTITGSTITSNSIVIKASDGEVEDVFTIYKAIDGSDGSKGTDGAPAPIAFLTNENITFSANAQGQISNTTIISNVVAYNGTTKVTPTIGTITNVPTGMTITPSTITASNEIMLTITIANNSTLGSASNNMGVISIPITSPVSTVLYLTWSKVNSGIAGVGVRSTTVSYGVSDSASTRPSDTAWQSTIPTVADGKYLWTRTVIDYTDDTVADTVTYTYAKQGVKGDTGSTGSSVTVSSIQYQEGASSTTTPTGNWSNSVVAVAEGKYLWTKTAFSDGKVAYGVAKQGVSGKDGVGINSITVDYGTSDSATVQPTTWQQSIPTVAEGKYLWTRTITDYTDASKADTVAYVYAKQGTKGDTGTAGTSITVKSIKYQSGTSATTAPTGTWSDSVVAVAEGNYLWTQTIFSDNKVAYGVAKQGAKGDKGDKGDTGAQGIQGIQGPKGDQGIQGPQGIDGKTSYFHIKYSANANGNPMTETPSTYIGTYVDYTEADSTDYTKYTWSRFVGSQGAKGDQGIAGTNGVDGQTSYLHIAYATSSNGSSGFSVSDSAGKTYIGQYTDHTQADSTDYTKYKWTLIKGDKGDKGDQGVQGPKGNDGQQYYTWVKYADTPTSGMSNDPDGKAYIGLAYNKTTATESNIYSDYMWSLIKGETGAVGPKGTDGQQYYTWIKYADNASGSNMSDSPSGKSYIGLAYNKTTSTESTTASDYTWALFKGDKGTAAVSFQVYAPNGYLLTKELESLTLQTFAYEGSTAITSGATYQWSQLIDEVWTAISGATSTTYTVTQADVLKAKSYRCVMTYKGQTYTSTVTVQDKTDIYNSIMCISSNATNNDCYWVLYTLVYSDSEEVDPLLGPISINAPSSPVSGDYWYAVDSTNATVTLKKYNGTNWGNSTDKQSLSYYWDMINDGSAQIPLGDSAKVKVISCQDFTATATLVCEVSNLEDGLLTQSSLSLTDASDPIVSADEPTATVNGQIWIKPNSNGTYLMFVWDEALNSWISSDMDTRNKVYTNRPSSYNAGDLWITASDTDHGSYLHGTLLQAQKSNTTYSASDWSPTLRYDQDIDEMKNTLNNLSQYVSITSAGLRIGARNTSGELSPFTSLFTSTELSFYQNSEKLLTLANNQLTAPRIVVEDDLEVQGSISLGNLKLIIENNGSFSFAVSK